MPELVIRPARSTDAPVVAALNRRAGGGIFEFLYDDRPGAPGAAEAMLEAVRASDTALSWSHALVAELDGAVVGAVTSQPGDTQPPSGLGDGVPADRATHVAPIQAMRRPGSWFINALAVDPGAGGQGVGRALVEAAADRARAAGFAELSLRVFTDNAGAIALYQNCGFRTVASVELGTSPRFAREGGVLLMLRDL